MSRTRRVARELGAPLVGIAGLLGIWALLAAATSTASIPSPAEVWRVVIDGIGDGTLIEATWKTMVRLAVSFIVAIAIGTGLGAALALHEFTRRAVRPIVVALQITPFVAWVPVAVVWFGVTERAVVFVAIVGAFPAMTLATLQAFRQVPPLLDRAGRTLGARGWERYRSVIFPAALPGYMAGLQQAWGFAWKALMAGELIVATAGASGLGHLLAAEQGNLPALLAALAVIVAIGVAVDYLVFGRLDRRIRGRRGLLAEG